MVATYENTHILCFVNNHRLGQAKCDYDSSRWVILTSFTHQSPTISSSIVHARLSKTLKHAGSIDTFSGDALL